MTLQVLDRAMSHFENAYHIPHSRATGYVCKTNLPSNTAFRGFGGPQGMLVAEHMVRHVAAAVGKDPVEVRARTVRTTCWSRRRPAHDTRVWRAGLPRRRLTDSLPPRGCRWAR